METANPAMTSFVRDLRWALQHLYDPGELPESPLVALLGLDPHEAGSALREILLGAIEALKPASSVPPENKAWRIYGALYHRYVDQFAQSEVARTLGLSVRQLRRQEHLAMRVLADQLWMRYDLKSRASARGVDPRATRDDPGIQPTPGPSREQELRWLGSSLPSEPVTAAELVESVLRTIAPLVNALAVKIQCSLPESLPHLTVQQAPARQAIVNTLTAAVRAAPGRGVSITAEAGSRQVSLLIQTQGKHPGRLPEGCAESLQMAGELARLTGGSLEVVWGKEGEPPFTARLRLPAVEQATVLIIDDNADALQLFQRYLADTPYACIGCSDPRQTLALAQELKPRVIVLDVMLPGVDGWELLGRLRADPDTGHIPVIVCTILPEEQLALALGAADFVRKPVSRPAFLAAVERQLGRRAQRSSV